MQHRADVVTEPLTAAHLTVQVPPVPAAAAEFPGDRHGTEPRRTFTALPYDCILTEVPWPVTAPA